MATYHESDTKSVIYCRDGGIIIFSDGERCDHQEDLIAKYQAYERGECPWDEVIASYMQYVLRNGGSGELPQLLTDLKEIK
jgi:hypothetical protein